jgi:2,3-bisphosphoglycerate-independent phosphoglycerate mutase
LVDEIIDKIRIQYRDSAKAGRRIPFLLLILDGWGMAPDWGGNAISLASTSVFDYLWKQYPKTTLIASGSQVGLPEEAPGNSEAGHLNIGAGKIVHQDITVIDEQISKSGFAKSRVFNEIISHVGKNHSNLHIMGLLSKTGTHSHIKHLVPLLKDIKRMGIEQVYLHLFSDGRDSDPMKGIEYMNEVEQITKQFGIGIVESVCGRFYAMDRDNRWGRIARAYNALTKAEAEKCLSAKKIFSQFYSRHISDEFIEPSIVVNPHQTFIPISDNDGIIMFNFRSDRVKQITRAFLDPNLSEFTDRTKLKNIRFATFTVYQTDDDLAEHIFEPEKVQTPLAKIISENNLRQFHCAETEKFPHVTYFINGANTKPYPKEDRLAIPSPKVISYDLVPKMSAEKVLSTLLRALDSGYYDFYIVNFANPDMVGHTGNLSASITAVKYIDDCLGAISKKILQKGGTMIVCADHGNVEQMVNPQTGEADTEHTGNPVPFILVNDQIKNNLSLQMNGALNNIAPTILELYGFPKPAEMSSRSSLIIRNK